MSVKNTNSNGRAKVWLKPNQVRDLQAAAQSDSFLGYLRDRNEMIVRLLYDTGLRVGELVQLDVDYLHLEDEQPYVDIPAHIQKDYPTDRSPKYQPMNLGIDQSTEDTVPRLRAYLNNRWKDSDAIFPSRQSDRMTTESVRRVIRSLAEEANVQPHSVEGGLGEPKDVTPHTMRHSVAYRMLIEEDGHTLYDVRNRLRHATIKTTEERYDHFDRI